MELFWKNYIESAVSTKWIAQVGCALMVGLAVYELLSIKTAIEHVDWIPPDLAGVLARQIAAIFLFLVAVIVRICVVSRSGPTNYRVNAMSWWFVFGVMGIYLLHDNYWNLSCYFTGEICLPVYVLTARPDYVQVPACYFYC